MIDIQTKKIDMIWISMEIKQAHIFFKSGKYINFQWVSDAITLMIDIETGLQLIRSPHTPKPWRIFSDSVIVLAKTDSDYGVTEKDLDLWLEQYT